ncbi:hypothetical protein RchiOBHm_Chr1g0320031 [Rosa chinensis]|uniref:Uncharacterized protein n=1 Tax=Rosa chinensis TaxID=74649 RepID=A0A2P6S8K3_ROSCH|nr:hypothetical protein RchiOBHm_Chr1g0320031 [Rosa chinensis]
MYIQKKRMSVQPWLFWQVYTVSLLMTGTLVASYWIFIEFISS